MIHLTHVDFTAAALEDFSAKIDGMTVTDQQGNEFGKVQNPRVVKGVVKADIVRTDGRLLQDRTMLAPEWSPSAWNSAIRGRHDYSR